MARVLGIGNALMDIVASIPHESVLEGLQLQRGSMNPVGLETLESILAILTEQNSTHEPQSGGSAVNVTRVLTRLGIATGFIGKIGRDDAGRSLVQAMRGMGITSLHRYSKARTGHSISLVLPDGERTFATFLGAAGTLNAQDIIPSDFLGYDFVHLEGYIAQSRTLMERILTQAQEHSLKVSLDLSNPHIIDTNREYLHRILPKYVRYLFTDDRSAKAFTGLEPQAALQTLNQLCPSVFIKQSDGTILAQHLGTMQSTPPIIVHEVDRTGMGDMLVAGTLFGIVMQWPLARALELAADLAREVVQVYGTHLPQETWLAVRDKYSLS